MTDPPRRSRSADDVRLPDNAFRAARPGRDATSRSSPPPRAVPEVTLRSIVQGALWSVVFSAAATYIALKLGQGIESAIPISILAVGFSVLAVRVLARAPRRCSRTSTCWRSAPPRASSPAARSSRCRRSTSSASRGARPSSRSSSSPLLGAVLGVFLLAPFRRYFVRDLHGKLPFPEARATTEILVAGQARRPQRRSSSPGRPSSRRPSTSSGPSMQGWAENFSTAAIGALAALHGAREGRLHDEHLGRGLRPRLHHGPRLRRHHHGRLDGLVLRPRAALRLARAARGRRRSRRAPRRSPRCPPRTSSSTTSGPSASAASSPPGSSRS